MYWCTENEIDKLMKHLDDNLEERYYNMGVYQQYKQFDNIADTNKFVISGHGKTATYDKFNLPHNVNIIFESK